MKSLQRLKALLPCLLVLALCVPASAAITLYDKENTTFSTDGSFNTFYVYSDDDAGQTQSRVKMGFLPNYIGFNFGKQAGNLKLGGRSSFWVTINDSDAAGTSTGIDVRQFYGTVDADWGQVLFGKDFTLFNRSNIFLDEILQGFGKSAGVPGIDTDGVSFGNIGSGYTYPLPSAQITYRTPDLAGFKLAVGIIDPSRTSGAGGEETTPRIEGELTFNKSIGQGSVTAWGGFLTQKSEKGASGDVDSQGLSYGLNGKIAGFSLTGSGFTGKGIGKVLGPGLAVDPLLEAGDEVDSNGYLVQASYTIDKVKLVGSYGKSKLETAVETEDETIVGAIFYSINDYLKLAAEYNVQTITTGSVDNEINTVALGAILNF
ncbi:MAG: porin [Desulfuromonadales bacterium]|nr:porin [Desulfuromonadales bacterium]